MQRCCDEWRWSCPRSSSSWAASRPFWCWAAGPRVEGGHRALARRPLGRSRVGKLELLRRESAFLPCARFFSLSGHRQFVSYDACVISMGTSVHDACVNSGRHMKSDACARTDSCGWAHAHGGGPGTKTLRQCSGNQVGRPAVNDAPHTASVEYYLRRPPKEVEVEVWEGRVVTCFRPKSWVERGKK